MHGAGQRCQDGTAERKPDGQEESPDHLLVCEAYSSLREGKDPELVRKDRVTYLRQVIKVRKDLESKL